MNKTISERLNKFLHVENIDDGRYTEFLHFMILWNLFEARLCKKNFSKKNIPDVQISPEVIESTLQYFQGRYTESNCLNYRFLYLENNRESKKDRELIEKVLLGEEKDQTAIIKALKLIIYRYRNNLFHGEKEIASLPNQQENFDYANNFLMTCLEENPSIL